MLLQHGDETRGPRESARPDRRSAVARLGALALSGGLAACGFRMRGMQQLPFASVFVAAPATSALGTELVRRIRSGTSTTVLDDRASAQGIIEVVGESRDREVLSVNAQGRAREYRLLLRVAFRVHDGKGREYLARTQISATRDLAVREEQLLAREYEEEQLYQDMLVDVVQQIMRRLSALKA